MKAIKQPSKMISQLGDAFRSTSEQQRQTRLVSAIIIFCGLAALYYYLT